MSIGMLLNNPFDLEITNIPWRGKITPGADKTFEQFDTMEHGLRAGFMDLLSAFNKHKRTTIKAIVTPYAPPEENNTDAYIAAVCKYTGYGEDDALNMNDLDCLLSVGEAILIQEQGEATVHGIDIKVITESAIDALNDLAKK